MSIFDICAVQSHDGYPSYAFRLIAKKKPGEVGFVIDKEPIRVEDIDLTLDELTAKIEDLIYAEAPTCDNDPFEITRARTRIAVKTRRGSGNATYKDIIAYCGSSTFDCGIIVVHNKQTDRYGFVKNENWQDYFCVIR